MAILSNIFGSSTTTNDNELNISGVKVKITPFPKPFVSNALFGLYHVNTLFNVGTAKYITLTFDKPVSEFGIDVIGSEKSGNRLVAYNAVGGELGTTEIAYKKNSDNFVARAQIESGQPIHSVRIIGTNGDKLSFRNISLEPATVPIQVPSEPFIPPVIPIDAPVVTPPSTPVINDVVLASIITISKPEINKQYVKDTLQTIPSETISFHNISSNIAVDVSLVGIQGVTFTPNTFSINPLGTVQVVINFDATQINVLPEGVSKINCMVNLSSKSVILNPPVPPVTPPPPPPPTLGEGMFLEEQFIGAPGGTESEDLIFSREPILRRTTDTIKLTPTTPVTVRWTAKQNFQEGYYTFRFKTDDGIRAFLDDTVSIFNFWFDQSPTDYTSRFYIPAGEHKLRIEYYNKIGSGVVEVVYSRDADVPPPPPANPGTPVIPEGGGSRPAPLERTDGGLEGGNPIMMT